MATTRMPRLSDLGDILDAQPRRRLYAGPSPIVRLSRLERAVGSPVAIYMKRDDQLRPLFGNKIRYLEFVLGLYDAQEADCLIHAGGMTSNYMSQLAMIGAAEGISVHLVLGGKRPDAVQGNPLVEELFGAHIHYAEGGDARSNSERKQALAGRLRACGGRPYVIDYPDSNYTAYLGYMRCYQELCEQGGGKPEFDGIFLCSGWHSYLGLRAGADFLGHDIAIKAFRPAVWQGGPLGEKFPVFEDFLKEKVDEFGRFMGLDISTRSFDISEEAVGHGYGRTDDRTINAMRLAASTEGILLDPIYTGKAFAGLLDAIAAGKVRRNGAVLFVHTGGIFNLFTFNREIASHLG